MRKLLLLILIALFTVSAVNAYSININYSGYCLQEQANGSSSCFGYTNGTYLQVAGVGTNVPHMFDADYSTYGGASYIPGSAGDTIEVRINYTKPNYASSGLFQHKSSLGYFNSTITQSCFNQSPIQLSIGMKNHSIAYGDGYIEIGCYYGASFNVLYNSYITDMDVFYEEAMWWNGTPFLGAAQATTNYSSALLERSQNTINLSINAPNVTSAYLFYNGTVYNAASTRVSDDSTTWYYVTITNNTILNGNNPTNITFYWNYSITDPSGTVFNGNTILSNDSQIIYRLDFNNCSTTNTSKVVSVNFFDEENPTTSFFVDAQAYVQVNYLGSQVYNFSKTFYNINFIDFCISPYYNLSQNTVTVYLLYNSSTGYANRYFVNKQTLNNVSRNYSAYALNRRTLTDVNGIVRDGTDYGLYHDVMALMQRSYVGEGVWRTVQEDLSDEFGSISFHVVETSQDYRFVFVDLDNNVLSTTGTIRFACPTGVCTPQFIINPYIIPVVSPSVVSVTYDNTTKNITTTWHQPEDRTVEVRITVTQENIGTTTFCDSTITGTSGSSVCSVSNAMGTLIVRVTQNNRIIKTEFVTVSSTSIGDALGAPTQGIIALIVALTLTFAGFAFAGPVGGVMMMLFSIIIMYLSTLLTALNLSVLIGGVAVGLFISLKVRR